MSSLDNAISRLVARVRSRLGYWLLARPLISTAIALSMVFIIFEATRPALTVITAIFVTAIIIDHFTGKHLINAYRQWSSPRRQRLDEQHRLNTHAASTRIARRIDEHTFEYPKIVAVTAHDQFIELTVRLLPGQTLEDYQTAAEALRNNYRAALLPITQNLPGQVIITIFTHDPLARALTQRPRAADAELARLPIGITQTAQTATLTLKNQSGLLLAGMPGAGKSEAINTILARLLLSRPRVQYAIIDAKNSTSTLWAQPGALFTITDISDLTIVANHLEDLLERMHTRAQHLQELNVANLWTHGITEKFPLIVLIIDEAQMFFDTKSLPREQRATAERITASIRTLILHGRAYGFYTILATQKPTADAVPTAIRDNLTTRIAFHVATDDAAIAVLGDAARTANYSPVRDIRPGQPGIAIMQDETGEFQRIRIPLTDPRHLS